MKKRTLAGALLVLGCMVQATTVEVAYSPNSPEESRIIMQGSCTLSKECGSIELDPNTRLTIELTKDDSDLCRLDCQLEVDGKVRTLPTFVTPKNETATLAQHDELGNPTDVIMIAVSDSN